MKTVEEMAQAMVALYGINATRAAIEEHTAMIEDRKVIISQLDRLVNDYGSMAEKVIAEWLQNAPAE